MFPEVLFVRCIYGVCDPRLLGGTRQMLGSGRLHVAGLELRGVWNWTTYGECIRCVLTG